MDDCKNMAVAYAMKKRAKKMAHGGEVKEMAEYDPVQNLMPKENEAASTEDADMIARIMHKRKMYSEGGMVANDTPPIADSMEADYDDLALRDDLESEYTGENSGDMRGSELNQNDLVSRAMLKRRKQTNPRPA